MIKGKQIEDSSVVKEKLNLSAATLGKDPIRKSEFDNRKINGKSLATDITLDKSDIGLSNIPNLLPANWPISNATQAALDALDTSIDNNTINITNILSDITNINNDINDLQDAQDELEVIVADNSDFIDTLVDTVLENKELDWQDVSVVPTGQSNNGATLNFANKTIAIASGSHGRGTYLEQAFNLALYPYLVPGDVIKIRALWTEQTLNSLSEINFVPTLNANGSNVSITPVITEIAPQLLEYTFEYTVQPLNNLIVRFTCSNNYPIQSSNSLYTWNNLDIITDHVEKNQTVDLIADTVNTVKTLNDYYVRSEIITTATANDVVDVTAQLQAEIDLAVATSGEFRLRRGTYKVSAPLVIGGALRIRGIGGQTIINPGGSAISVFQVRTDRPVIFEDFSITRNGTGVSTGIEFTDFVVNSRTQINKVYFNNIQTAIKLDYATDLTIQKCTFINITDTLLIGTVDPTNVKNISILDNVFDNCGNTCIRFLYANGFKISGNKFISSNGANHSNVCISMSSTIGNDTLIISENTFHSFRSYAIILTTTGSGTLRSVNISDNIFDDKSSSTLAAPIAISNAVNDAISEVTISNNTMRNKQIAMYIVRAKSVMVIGNTIQGLVGSVNTRAFSFDNTSYMKAFNIQLNQANPNSFNASTLIADV